MAVEDAAFHGEESASCSLGGSPKPGPHLKLILLPASCPLAGSIITSLDEVGGHVSSTLPSPCFVLCCLVMTELASRSFCL